MQVQTDTDPGALLDRLIGDALPDRRGLGAWRSLLRAHASLMRQLATDLVTETGRWATSTCSLSWRRPAVSCA